MRLIVFFIILSFILGCVAVVDESSGLREIKSLIITKEETNDLLDRVNDTEPSQKHQIQLFQGKETE